MKRIENREAPLSPLSSPTRQLPFGQMNCSRHWLAEQSGYGNYSNSSSAKWLCTLWPSQKPTDASFVRLPHSVYTFPGKCGRWWWAMCEKVQWWIALKGDNRITTVWALLFLSLIYWLWTCPSLAVARRRRVAVSKWASQSVNEGQANTSLDNRYIT